MVIMDSVIVKNQSNTLWIGIELQINFVLKRYKTETKIKIILYQLPIFSVYLFTVVSGKTMLKMYTVGNNVKVSRQTEK